MITHSDIFEYINTIAPFHTAADFDNAGFLIGNPNSPATGVMVALDATLDVLEQAKTNHCSLVISHHPIIFEPLKQVNSNSIAFNYIKSDLSVISAHTNLDQALGGVGDCLASALNLSQVHPFEPSEQMGRIGQLPRLMHPDEFASYVGKKLHTTVRYTKGVSDILTVAVLGGSGDFAWKAAQTAGADAFVTGESKHHVFLAACNAGFCYVDATHYATEVVVCNPLKERLQKQFSQLFVMTANQQAPFFCTG